MDSLAFRIANLLVGNPEATEAIEMILVPGVQFAFQCYVEAAIAVTGKGIDVSVDGKPENMWSRIIVPSGGVLRLGAKPTSGNPPTTGSRVYLSIRGGFPDVPRYLGSKSTSMGFGGYQVCLRGALTSSHTQPHPRDDHLSVEINSRWATVHHTLARNTHMCYPNILCRVTQSIG